MRGAGAVMAPGRHKMEKEFRGDSADGEAEAAPAEQSSGVRKIKGGKKRGKV